MIVSFSFSFAFAFAFEASNKDAEMKTRGISPKAKPTNQDHVISRILEQKKRLVLLKG